MPRFKVRGQLLIEALIAISLIVIGLLGIFALLSQSLGLRRVVSEQYVATYLASEGVEVIKNMIDSNHVKILQGQAIAWNAGLTPANNSTYEIDHNDTILQADTDRLLKYNPVTGLYGYTSGENSIFERQITLNCSSPCNEITVNSRVSWITRGGGSFSVDVEDHFYDWVSSP